MDLFNDLRRFVPNIPDLLVDNCIKTTESIREQAITNNRATILIMQMKKEILPNDLVPISEDSLITVLPQQIQFISLLIDFLQSNPQILIKCLKDRFQNPDSGQFNYLCFSAIPAIFGFFSSSEHISLSFSFYCLLIGTCTQQLVEKALIPFYSCACTYKYTEAIFNQFAIKFCNDIRLNAKSISQKIIEEYIPLAIQSIKQAFKLLPQQHQFLLKFMKTQGWKDSNIFHFFLHKFTFPQLLRFLKSTPFKNHFPQLVALAKSFTLNRIDILNSLNSIFDDYSIFEIPSAFSVFQIPYTQILISSADVNALVMALLSVNELPKSINPFVTHHYLTKIDHRPFWIKIYSKKPKPADQSYNWRKVVFEEKKLNKTEFSPNQSEHFSRMWNQLISECTALGVVHPVLFLTEEPKTPIQKTKQNIINQSTREEHQNFVTYCLDRSLEKLEERAATFETYLVYRLAFKTLSLWLNTINDSLTMIVIPFAETTIEEILSHIMPRQIIGYPKIIDQILEEAATKIDMPITRQLHLLKIVEFILPALLNNSKIQKKVKSIESRWQEHVESMRINIKLPPEFSNRSKNIQKAVALNEKLLSITAHLGSIRTMSISNAFLIFHETLNLIKSFEFIEENTESILQYCIAYCDCSSIITKFIITNSLVVKQDRFALMSDPDNDQVLWYKLESSIIRLLASDPDLLNDCLSFQTYLIEGKFV